MQNGLNTAGNELKKLGDTPAAQNTRVFIMGLVEETSESAVKVGESIGSAVDKAKNERWNEEVANWVEHVGGVIDYGAVKIWKKKADEDHYNIPIEISAKLLGLDAQGDKITSWISHEIDDFGWAISESVNEMTTVYTTLLRDPEEFGEMIEDNPLLLYYFFKPHYAVLYGAQYRYSEKKIKQFADYDGDLIDLPKEWFS